MQPIIQVTLPSTALPEDAQAYFAKQYETPFVVTIKLLPDGTARYALAPFGEENARLQTPRVAYNEGSFGRLVTGTLPAGLAEEIIQYTREDVRTYSSFMQHAREALRMARELPILLQRIETTQQNLSSVEDSFQQLSAAYAKHVTIMEEHVRVMENAYESLNERLLLQDAQLTKVMRDVQELSRILTSPLSSSSNTLAERVTTLEGMLTAQMARAEDAVTRAAHAEALASEAGGKSMTALATALDAQATARKAYALTERLSQDLTAYQQRMTTHIASFQDTLRSMKAHVYPQIASLEGRVQENTYQLARMQDAVAGITQRMDNLEAFEKAMHTYVQVNGFEFLKLEEKITQLEEQTARQDLTLTRMTWALGIETLILAGAALAYGIKLLSGRKA